MHSLTCSPTSRVGDRASSPELPDDNIPLLRAKLAIYFFSDAKDGTPAKILHGRCIDACLDGAKRPWPPVNYTSGNESPSKTKEQKRHVVLNSISWELDEMPALANAKRIANNPPLECGAGFVLWGMSYLPLYRARQNPVPILTILSQRHATSFSSKGHSQISIGRSELRA